MNDFDRYKILKDAKENGGTINYSVKTKSFTDSPSKRKYRALLVELDGEGYLNDPSRTKTLFHLTALGEKVLQFDSFEEYEEEKKRDPALAIISSTFKEIASLNSKYAEIKDGSIKIQKSANIFTGVTIVLLFVQTIFVALEYIYPPEQSLNTTLREQVQQNKHTKSNLKELGDSSTMELQKPTKKTDSSYNDSIK